MKFLTRPNAFLMLSEPRYSAFALTLLDSLYASDLGGAGDLTSSTLGLDLRSGSATIKAKESGILAGLEEVTSWLRSKGVTCQPDLMDGAKLNSGERIMELEGNFATLLQTERTALNALQRLSGIATTTAELSLSVRTSLADATTNGEAVSQSTINNQQLAIPKLSATRKTPWGYLDKRAVQLGGGWPHRLGLWDAILIKDNHLAALAAEGAKDPIRTALERVIASGTHSTFVELEVRSKSEIEAFIKAAEALRDRLASLPLMLMLDNFTPDELEQIIPPLRQALPPLEFNIELSGGITAGNLLSYAKCGADILSLGSLTHSAIALDLSMELHHHE